MEKVVLGLKSVESNIQIVSKDNLNHDSKAVSSNNRRYRFDYWVILCRHTQTPSLSVYKIMVGLWTMDA